MMGMSRWMEEVGDGPRPESLEHLQSLVGIEWVREALERGGSATIRHRKLPNEAVVWLVIGIALLREYSIEDVARHLGLFAKQRRPANRKASSSALVAGRQRVGPEPLVELFGMTAEAWTAERAEQNRWRGLSLYALDGTALRLPDTEANEEVYGRPGSSRGGAAGYPQARLVGLLTLGSRILADLVVGSWDQGEVSLARMLFGNVPAESLLMLDRGFVDYALFATMLGAAGERRHFLCRAKKNAAVRVVEELGENDALVELRVPSARRAQDRSLPETIVVRRIRYQVQGHRPGELWTSLVDAAAYPAAEIAEMYHRRWEIELAYDEIKTHTLEREETIRSRHPDGVLQEIYGLAIAYNVVRVMMARAAEEAGVEPNRMSFRGSLVEIRVFLLAAPAVAPGAIPMHYRRLCEHLVQRLIPKRRRSRRYPRAVKVKMSGFPRKRSK